MPPVLAPTLILPPREEWPDADFDLPDGAPLHAPSDKDDEDEDWDIEMDIGQTGGAKVKDVVAGLAALPTMSTSAAQLAGINIRPPLQFPDSDDEDGEGVSTIKATVFPTSITLKPAKPVVEPIEEDFEDAFALPTDMTQLSLAPLSLSHRASKNSLEWGDKDNSSSSQSSDAYSSLGFTEASPSSNSTSSPSLPDTETEEEDEELEGLVLPNSLFSSGQTARQLKKILDMKKKAQLATNSVKLSRPDPEDDFEMGLVINDDVDLSPSRLIYNTQHQSQRNFNRSNSMPPQRPSTLHPPSRPKLERSKSPANPPPSSVRQLQKLRLSPSPPLHPPTRTHTYQSLLSSFPTPPPPPSSNNNFLSAKPGSLRGQKSHSGLKPPASPASALILTRKASLSSLTESNLAKASGSGSTVVMDQAKLARYEEPTAASRAKSHKSSLSRIHDFKVPPTRPCTPSSNPAALRLTMPTQSRLKVRPALSQVFGSSATATHESPFTRSSSPIPPRPPSTSSMRASVPLRSTTLPPTIAPPKLLRRPKRPRTYGDGTELDGIEDLQTDREKEVRYRVQPKGYGNRIPGSTFASKTTEQDKMADKGAIKKKGKRDGSAVYEPHLGSAPSTNTLRRTTTRIEFPSVPSPLSEVLPKKKKHVSSPTSSTTKRKPTLIRNLGSTGAPKVVGEMKWNPQTLRWEGNDHVLRDFDAAIGTSMRPALITHLTGSAMGSPMGSYTSGARIVGNMVFNPTRMCWVSTLPPEEDEPDVFANLADDEEDGDAWESKSGTIRAIVPRVSEGGTSSNGRTVVSSPTSSHSRSISESGSDRGSRASLVVREVDDTFIQSCRKAEARHRAEMKGWKTSLPRRDASVAPDRSYLFEIRALATRKY